MTDVVLPLITKRCSMKKEEGDEELMESILLDLFGQKFWPGGIIWSQLRRVSLGSFGPTLSSGKGKRRKEV